MVAMEPVLKDGAPSWQVRSDLVEAWVTVRGAHVAPVEFTLAGTVVQPYAIAPWAPGSIPELPPLLDALRGDFLCLPFGAQLDGPQHGETASASWTLVDEADGSLTLHLDATDIGASVDKTVSLRPGQTVLYQEFRIAGLDGDYNYGTHPILDFSREAPGGARISTSPFVWAATNAGQFSDPAAGETQVLARDAQFASLSAIPREDGGVLDVSRYPTAPGHEDLVMLVADPVAGPIGWAAASCTGYVWFSLKDITTFPATLLWISNGGRTREPWNGVHTARMGIEDVCSYFADGLEASRADPLQSQGVRTNRHFVAGRPVTLRTVQGVAATPHGFGRVADIATLEPGLITITDDAGRSVTTSVDWQFVVEPESI
jgi:hypothetical protein